MPDLDPPVTTVHLGAPATMSLTGNDQPGTVTQHSRTTLVDHMRDELSLSGTKRGCDALTEESRPCPTPHKLIVPARVTRQMT
jgi:hypothetical protein